MPDQPDLTIPDLARLLRLSPETLRSLARLHRLPGAYKVGRNWRISRDAIERLRTGRQQ